MEDLKTYHDFTVRDNNDDIIQFMYGQDGFESIYLEKQSTKFILINSEDLYKNYLFKKDEKFDDYILKKSIASMKKNIQETNYF